MKKIYFYISKTINNICHYDSVESLQCLHQTKLERPITIKKNLTMKMNKWDTSTVKNIKAGIHPAGHLWPFLMAYLWYLDTLGDIFGH